MDIHSIDIIVPTFRLNEEILLRIIHLPKPPGYTVCIYIISDNPAVIVPAGIQELARSGHIKLLINEKNCGAPATRNVGIRAGTSKWILLLDDDIKPQDDLLMAYAAAMEKNTDAIGFAGVTYFPEPFNAVTTALSIHGSVASFTLPLKQSFLRWTPTANVVLNREKMHPALFDAALVNGEDIDFLARSSFMFNEQYIAVPDAVVFHPWWNEGKPQTARMLSYGTGASQIARKEPVKTYTYRDFSNTSETALLLLLLLPLAYVLGHAQLLLLFFVVLLIAEFATCWLKAIIAGKVYSPVVAFHILWTKNCWEAAYLYRSLADGHMNGFMQRIELGFVKPHPGPFRTNRWKIIKMILLAVLFLIAVIAF